jgi:hypothetical protein
MELKIPPELIRSLIYCPETGKLFWARTSKNKNMRIWEEAGSYREVTGGGTKYCNIEFKGVRYAASRIVWVMKKRRQPKGVIDHISGNTQDNRIENLRDVSTRENCRNRVEHRAGKPVGVSFNSKSREYPWVVHSGLKGKPKYLGCFELLQNAIIARFLYENDGFIRPKPIYEYVDGIRCEVIPPVRESNIW